MTELSVEKEQLAPPPGPPVSSNATSGWASATFDAFQIKTYRTIWFGTFLAFIAFNMANTAQNVVAYDLTGNNRAVGLVAFGQGIAMFFLNPFGGAIADRFPKRTLVLVAQALLFAVMLTIAILIVTNSITIAFLALGAFSVGTVFSFLGPTRTALVGEIVPEGRLGNAVALLQVGGSVSRISGPFIASMLIAWSVTGAAGAYFVIAGIFVLVSLTFYQVPPSPPLKKRETSVLQDIRLGFRHVIEDPRRLHLLVSFHLITMLGMSFQVLMPGLAKDVLNAGTTGLGLMLGVGAMGGLFLSLVVASLADSRKAPTYLMLVSLGSGVSLILLGLAPNFAVALLVMLMVGGCTAAFQTLNNAVAIRFSNSDYYGRMMSLMFLAWGITLLVNLPVGYLADVFGERAVISTLGLLLCCVVGLLTVWQRRIGAAAAEPSIISS